MADGVCACLSTGFKFDSFEYLCNLTSVVRYLCNGFMSLSDGHLCDSPIYLTLFERNRKGCFRAKRQKQMSPLKTAFDLKKERQLYV